MKQINWGISGGYHTRDTLYLAAIVIYFSHILTSQGVIQNFKPYQAITLMQPSDQTSEQILPMGPVASQIAIKQLGTNGGDF